MPSRPSVGPVLLYDGTCGLCAGSVELVRRHDRRKLLKFAALDSDFGRGVIQRHPEIADVDSLLWVEPGDRDGQERVLARSDAALRVADYLGGLWRVAAVAKFLPRSGRDALYRFVARHRHHLAPSIPINRAGREP